MNHDDTNIKRYYLLHPTLFPRLVTFVFEVSGNGESSIRLRLIFRPNEERDLRRLNLIFKGVKDLKFTPSSDPVIVSFLEITNIHGRQWDGVDYAVSDEHGEQVLFTCASFEAAVSGEVLGRQQP